MEATVVRGDFESVYRAHFARIRGFVFHFVQNAAVADELTQDAFVKALEGWAAFRGESPERVWLLRIARNVCLDHLRGPRSPRRAAASLDLLEAEGLNVAADSAGGGEPRPSVEQAAVQAEMSDCVQQFVLSLPETLRTPLILHDMHELTNGEIAEVLGCSLQAAKMRLHRAREKLREMIEQRCDLFHDERNVLSCTPAPLHRAFAGNRRA